MRCRCGTFGASWFQIQIARSSEVGFSQAFDLVEEIVIEAIDDRIDGALQIGEIDQPADGGIDRAAHRHLAAERVAVHAAALVSLRYMR